MKHNNLNQLTTMKPAARVKRRSALYRKALIAHSHFLNKVCVLFYGYKSGISNLAANSNKFVLQNAPYV